VEAIDCGDQAAQWFGQYLNRKDVRLVYADPNMAKRRVLDGPTKWHLRAREFDIVSIPLNTSRKNNGGRKSITIIRA